MDQERFKMCLEFGRLGESLTAKWLLDRGNFVLPVYEIENADKGPRLYAPDRSALIATDMLVISPAGRCSIWIETKTKTGFTQLRRENRDGKCGVWQTGIDRRYFCDYRRIDEESGYPVWLLFLQRGGQTKDSPAESPAGLYGNSIENLKDKIDHEHDFYEWEERPAMVYWNIYDLYRLATIESSDGAERLIDDPESPWDFINVLF